MVVVVDDFCCWQMIFFLQPKPRRSDGDEEGFICCVPPSSLLEGHSQEEHVVSIALINPICHDYSPNARRNSCKCWCTSAAHYLLPKRSLRPRTFTLQRFLPPNRSMTHNQLNAALLNYLTYELEEKIKLIVAITLFCFDGNSVCWMAGAFPPSS